ncbi:hypothetical protein [Rhodococcus sp. 1168]|uniref:hypothetical protein n=1 Tax=Rhodococcus sp. 1168 TaxID=2018041 RepID=UPI001594D338|nr:hypothetical protein [Rhodococcus sp. 1168]
MASTPGVANADQFRNGQWIFGSIEQEFIRFLNPDNSSRIGEPTSGELLAGSDGRGRWQSFGFDTNRIVWSPDVDPGRGRQIGGFILQKWLTYGVRPNQTPLDSDERGRLKYPTTAEEPAVGGRYNNFQGGAITYEFGKASAYATWGDIRNTWSQNGYETGQYGFPSSDELRCAAAPSSNGTFGAAGQLFKSGSTYITSGVSGPFGNRIGYTAVDAFSKTLKLTGSTKYQTNLNYAVGKWNDTSAGLGKVTITQGASAGSANLTVSDVNIPGGFIGQYSPGNRTLQFNDVYLAPGAPSYNGTSYANDTRRNHTASHELGHALGLYHSCETQLMTPINSTVQGPNPLDRTIYNNLWSN